MPPRPLHRSSPENTLLNAGRGAFGSILSSRCRFDVSWSAEAFQDAERNSIPPVSAHDVVEAELGLLTLPKRVTGSFLVNVACDSDFAGVP